MVRSSASAVSAVLSSSMSRNMTTLRYGSGDPVEALVVAAHDDLVERSLAGTDAVYYLFVCQALGFQSFECFHGCFYLRECGGGKRLHRGCGFIALKRISLFSPCCVTEA